MIACVSPASAYIEETASTLNYATRAMNIRNRPILQVDSNEHLILNLRREAHLLRLENEYLKEQLVRATGGMPPLMVDFANAYDQQPAPSAPSVSSAQPAQAAPPSGSKPNQEHHVMLNKLREENARIRREKEKSEKQYQQSMQETQSLYMKLENLESAFVGTAGMGSDQEYTISSLVNENTSLKQRLNMTQEEHSMLRSRLMNPREAEEDFNEIQGLNEELQRRVEALQKRERELLEQLMKAQKSRK